MDQFIVVFVIFYFSSFLCNTFVFLFLYIFVYRIAGNIGGNNIWRIAGKSAIGGFNFGGPRPPRVKGPSQETATLCAFSSASATAPWHVVYIR